MNQSPISFQLKSLVAPRALENPYSTFFQAEAESLPMGCVCQYICSCIHVLYYILLTMRLGYTPTRYILPTTYVQYVHVGIVLYLPNAAEPLQAAGRHVRTRFLSP